MVEDLLLKELRDNDENNRIVITDIHSPLVDCSELYIPTLDTSTRVLLYRPVQHTDGRLPVFINLHGGGFALGYPEADDPYCRQISEKTACLVVNVDYPLAPETKFPGALESVYDVVKWVIAHSNELGIDSERIAIGGHSAGGNLAAATSLLSTIRQEFRFVLQILDYPPLDLVTDADQKSIDPDADQDFILISRKFNAWYLTHKNDAENPLASPIYAEDVSSLPPALIITAEKDLLCEEARLYADKLQQAGVPITYRMFEGCHHGFTHDPSCPSGEEAWDLMCTELTRAFNPS
ncbi:MAG: alpha/beta hydrolase [Paenibacillus sp.]|nr:alpha/beta hydrolase [Paenibacillus sp.]